MNKEEKVQYLLGVERYTVDDLVLLVEVLRGEGGCPWDMEQTHKSIRNDFIEETYEVIEAIDTDNAELLREELGDVMLQVVFHAQIERENGVFNLEDVSDEVCRKLIHRHPHVFGTVKVESTDQVLSNWDKIKNDEKSRESVTDRLRAVPPMLPALMRAAKVGKRASCFDFGNAEEVIAKLYEEMDEVKEAVASGDNGAIDEEIGDLLLTVTSLARKVGIDPEASLNRATVKFIDRFEKVENSVLLEGKDIKSISMTELDKIWKKIK